MTLEMKEWQRIVRHKNILRKVPDIHGDTIYTDEQMFTYLQQFEKDFAKCSVPVIDASGGGTRKAYCQTMDFATAAETLCVAPIPQERFAYLDELEVFNRSRLAFGQEQLKKRIEEVEGFEAISRETVSLVTDMLGLLEDQGALNRKMIRLDELRTMVKHRAATYKLVMYVSQGAEMYRFREDRKIGKDSVEGKERQRRQLQRDIAYVSELVEGCERLLDMLRHCQKRFEAALTTGGAIQP
jgi:hypothetical protein